MKKNMIHSTLIFAAILVLAACGSKPAKQEEKVEANKRPTLVEIKKKKLIADAKPPKGKFIEYIYMISPDHKKEAYSVNKTKLADGYAYGSGPYDGWLAEWFLFRGLDSDIVFEQLSGWEVQEKDKTYGFKLTPYVFRDMKKQKMKVSDVLPVVYIDELYEKQIREMKSNPKFENWQFYKLMKLPINGTTIDLKVCKLAAEPPFATETPCALIGHVKSAKSNFTVEPVESFTISKETI